MACLNIASGSAIIIPGKFTMAPLSWLGELAVISPSVVVQQKKQSFSDGSKAISCLGQQDVR